MTIFQKRFIQAKEESGLKWIEIAKRSGLDKASISQYKNGVHTPEPDALYRLSKTLNVSMTWLTGAENTKVSFPVSDEDAEILNRYHQLDDAGKLEFTGFLDDLIKHKNNKR